MTCGIYMITTPSGDRYVGRSVNIESRWKSHHHKGPNNRLEVLEECPKEDLDEREKYWIYTLKPELNVQIVYRDWQGTLYWTSPEAQRIGLEYQAKIRASRPPKPFPPPKVVGLEKLRRRKKISIEEVSNATGVPVDQLAAWEKGALDIKLTLAEFNRVAQFYTFSPETFFRAYGETFKYHQQYCREASQYAKRQQQQAS